MKHYTLAKIESRLKAEGCDLAKLEAYKEKRHRFGVVLCIFLGLLFLGSFVSGNTIFTLIAIAAVFWLWLQITTNHNRIIYLLTFGQRFEAIISESKQSFWPFMFHYLKYEADSKGKQIVGETSVASTYVENISQGDSVTLAGEKNDLDNAILITNKLTEKFDMKREVR